MSLGTLFLVLVFLILLSGFFSGSETGMMSLNRYRLRHLTRKNHRAAKRVSRLLKRPDRLLGVILIGNTFANVFASAVATVIATTLYGDIGIIVATVLLTLIILIFSEVTPKTLAALYPQAVSFWVSLPLKLLLHLLYPLVWLANTMANSFLSLFGIKVKKQELEALTGEELRTVVNEAVGKISPGYQEMLLSVLDLGKSKVEHIMIPRQEIVGIDLTNSWEGILDQLRISQHTRLPLYRESIDQVQGIIHVRTALHLLAQNRLSKTSLLENAEEIYFIPEGTQLDVQLANFKNRKVRIGFVVDEYGDIQGLVTLEDILEEIVGQFTTDIATETRDVRKQKDGSYLVDGSINVRELNRILDINLPVEGPSTLNGLILEQLETLPKPGVGMRIADYPLEVLEVEGKAVKLARISPKLVSRREED